MRILVCGSREWTRRDIIETVFDSISREDNIDVVIEGECKGADKISRRICQDRKMKYDPYFAKWNEYGLSAGNIRNTRMLEEGKPDLILAFYTGIENSKGTKNMINQGVAAGVDVILVSESPDHPDKEFEVTPIHDNIS